MHWLTRHLLRERQVSLILAPLFFLCYGFILLVIWKNGIDLFFCLSFMIMYMVIDYLAALRKYNFLLGSMPIAMKTIRLVSYQYIGLMGFIYSVCFTGFFLISESFFHVFSVQQRVLLIMVELAIILLLANGLLFIDVWTSSSLQMVLLTFLLLMLVLPNATEISAVMLTITWWQALLTICIAIGCTYAVWHLYPKRLQLKDVSNK